MSELNWNEALKGWKVTFSIGHRPSDRWEVYTPKGCGGVVGVDSVADWTVRELLDRMSAAPVAELTPWTGDGLPPVGVEVEWHECQQTGWQRVTVLAYHGDEAWIAPAGKPSIVVGNPANFRPIRTPEQIAEEERNAAIVEIGRLFSEGGPAAIYFAGYRKAGDA